MEIIYSSHAQKRMRERKISKTDVVLTIRDPNKQTSADRNRIIIQKKFGIRTLELIYVIENSKIIVITLYYL